MVPTVALVLSAGAMLLAPTIALANSAPHPMANEARSSSPGGHATAQKAQDAAPRGPELRLPGMPPIQLPPGAKVFGPNSERTGPSDTAPSPPRRPGGAREADSKRQAGDAAAKKAQAKPKPKGRDAILTDLFNRLGKAKSRAEARGIVGAIERAWLQSGSDTADLLMRRALQALKKKNYKLALRLLDKIVVIQPEWSEVWNQRATARYYDDNPDGAVADIAEALAREPRHFSALVGLGLILRRAKQEDLALKVLRQAITINPQLQDIKKTIEKLELSVEGQGI